MKKGDLIYYAGARYEIAEIKPFPHGDMIGIYDEPPSKHIDYLQKSNVKKTIDCFDCQGGGCPTCNGYGWIIN